MIFAVGLAGLAVLGPERLAVAGFHFEPLDIRVSFACGG
jgi:hypothetical protein